MAKNNRYRRRLDPGIRRVVVYRDPVTFKLKNGSMVRAANGVVIEVPPHHRAVATPRGPITHTWAAE